MTKEQYLATLPAEQVKILNANSVKRAAHGLPDWFCALSPTHAHWWVQETPTGPWTCLCCDQSVRSFKPRSTEWYSQQAEHKAAAQAAKKSVVSL